MFEKLFYKNMFSTVLYTWHTCIEICPFKKSCFLRQKENYIVYRHESRIVALHLTIKEELKPTVSNELGHLLSLETLDLMESS